MKHSLVLVTPATADNLLQQKAAEFRGDLLMSGEPQKMWVHPSKAFLRDVKVAPDTFGEKLVALLNHRIW